MFTIETTIILTGLFGTSIRCFRWFLY